MLLRLALVLPVSLALATPSVAQLSLKSIGDACLESTLADCTVASSGFAAPRDAGRIAWQVQRGMDEYGGIAGGAVVFAETDGAWTVLASDFTGVYYEMPRLADVEDILFHIPGVTAGTGAFNADLMFEYDVEDEAWRRVDLDAWWDEIDASLPEGLSIWKGVRYGFGEWGWGDLNARTGLWRDGDGNCCPSGGSAVIHFNLEDGKLAVGDVDYLPPEAEATD